MTQRTDGICLAEYALKDFEGHYFSYVNSIYKSISARQLQFMAMARTDAAVAIRDSFPVAPIFHALPYRRYLPRQLRFLLDPIGANWFFYRDLMSLAPPLDQRWLVLSVTAEASNVIAWAMWLRRFNPNEAPALALMLHFSYFNTSTNRWRPSLVWLRAGLWMLERLASGRYRIFLTTDSEILVAEYRRLTRLPIHVLPIPHTATIKNNGGEAARSGDAIKMVSLGGLRLSKGFGLLAKTIERLSERKKLHGLSFALQCYHDPGQPGSDSITLLKRLDLPNVELIETPLNEADYLRLLEDSHVVLIPFFREIYHSSTSGTFTEALAAGKPVVVTNNTWMSAQLARYGAGATFRDQDVDDLARAICEVRDNYPRLAAKARTRRAAWVTYHNPDNFVDKLLKVVSGTPERDDAE